MTVWSSGFVDNYIWQPPHSFLFNYFLPTMLFFRSFAGQLSLWFSVLLLSLPAAAQDSFLWIDGALEDVIANDDSYNTGGVIVVNGHTMNVPKNVLVQFPSAWVPFKDFAANKEDFLGFEAFVSSAQSDYFVLH